MVKNRNKESDEENNYVSLEGSTKNQKARTIELNKEAKYILQKIKYSRDSSLPDEFIVTTKTGKINTEIRDIVNGRTHICSTLNENPLLSVGKRITFLYFPFSFFSRSFYKFLHHSDSGMILNI